MSAETLAVIFAGLMALAILIYAILDGFDLGVGILLPLDHKDDSDHMIASIGPFWDANETWLVLAVGILLIAFPSAHGLILGELYLPVFVMLLGLILRGVAFDFRAKAAVSWQGRWNLCFKLGSVLTALAQGFMLGLFVMGFERSFTSYLFAVVSAVCVSAAYAYIGGAWLVMKSEGELQLRAAYWARRAGWFTAFGVFLVSVLNPVFSSYVADKWFGSFTTLMLLPIPVICIVLFAVVDRYLAHMPHSRDFGCWIPFAGTACIFFLCFQALAYSYFPYVVPGQLTIWQAASSPASLRFMLVGVVLVVPAILAYTAFSYRIFWGKARELTYS